MARSRSRPAGGRPPGRVGGAGTRPGGRGGGGGTRNTTSDGTTTMAIASAVLFLVLPVVLVGGVGAFLLHGYGML
jgi:hypothetical protein